MDLEPFSRINPCGYQGLAVTQVTELVNGEELGLKTEADYMHTVEKLLLQELITRTGVYGWIDVRQTLPT